MRRLALLALANLLIVNLLAQQVPPSDIGALMQKLRRAHADPRPGGPGVRIQASVLADPKQLKGFLQQQTIKSSGVTAKAASATSKAGSATLKPVTLASTCINTALFQTVGFTHNVIGVTATCVTQDNNVLIAGVMWDSTATHPGWQDNGFLLKCDMNGNIIWVLPFQDLAADEAYYFNPLTIKEEPDGSLMMASYFSAGVSVDTPVTSIYHLTAAGAIIWHKELKSNFIQATNRWTYFDVKDINPGENGDYIISGTTIDINYGAQAETVVRLDANGNYIWDINLTNKFSSDYDLGAEGMTAYLNGSSIVSIGLSHGNSGTAQSYETATIFTTLDYATGTVQSERYFVYPVANYGQALNTFTFYNNYATQLNNGHFLVYGALLGADAMETDTTGFFGVQEFDANFNPVNSYALNSLIHTTEVSNIIFFDNNANGFISIMQSANSATTNLNLSTIRNGQIARQRFVTLSNSMESGSYTHGGFLNDGSCFIADSYDDPSPGAGAYMSMRKMYDTDTASVCLGQDTLFVFEGAYPVQEDPGYLYLDPPLANLITEVSDQIGQGTTTWYTDNPCLRNSYCTLLSIQGPVASCGVNQPQLYKATRNPQCGATPQWQIDTTVISSITPVNDTTVSILFKNVNWQGKIYATIPTGSCVAATAADSLALAVISAPAPPSLFPDTILCTGNTIILHAGPIYASYLWQDGSTDSNYTVTNTGTYSVAVTDACGNNYSASTLVTPANFPFTLGADITKCNNDSVTLTATGGFIDYQWNGSPANIVSDSVITADPLTNTTYSVTAQKWPGCMVNSSVTVNVLTSPAIKLGDDTSFCFGGSVTLDAGAGFANYSWSTGAVSQQIAASQSGTYIIAASAANGCTSRDTFAIDAVYPLPVFSLGGPDTVICSNQSLEYAFGGDGDQYLWSDGLSSPGRVIDQSGTYGLTVTTPYGCTMSESIIVSVKQAPTMDLGSDTTLCKGSSVVLNAGDGNVSSTYLWQDGSTGQDYTVTGPGVYFATASVNGCSMSDTITVAYTGPPEFSLGIDTVLCPGQSFALQPSTPYTGQYQWQDGSTQNSFVVQDTGTYTLSISNVCGSSTAAVSVQPGLCRLAMPSAFTPNGDGRNDVFRVKYPFTASKFHMMVFDRWGMEVFASDNMEVGWDGTFRGAAEPVGTYVWFISLVDDKGVVDMAKGTVILIR